MWTQIPWPEEESTQCMFLALCLLVASSPSSSWKACLLLVLPVRLQCTKTKTLLQLLNGIQKDTYISINKLGIQWFLRANQGRLINLASCLINEL